MGGWVGGGVGGCICVTTPNCSQRNTLLVLFKSVYCQHGATKENMTDSIAEHRNWVYI